MCTSIVSGDNEIHFLTYYYNYHYNSEFMWKEVTEGDAASEIVSEYKQSLLYSCKASVRVKSSSTVLQIRRMTRLALRFVRARSLSPVVDSLLRFSACAPHICMDLVDIRKSEDDEGDDDQDRTDLDCSGKTKWSMMQKVSASFAQLLAYSCNRCHADGFSRVLIPYAVGNHWNMIIVDIVERTALLFEPNGLRYASENPRPTQVLSRAVQSASRWTSLLERVRVCGGEGVQTALGLETRTVYGSRIISQKMGLPICGAVIFWVVSEWMGKGANMRFDDFIELLLSEIDKDKPLHVQRVTTFLKSLNSRMRETYASEMDRALRADFRYFPAPKGANYIHIRVGKGESKLQARYCISGM